MSDSSIITIGDMRECLAGGTLQYIGGVGTYNGDDDYCPTYSLIKTLEGKKNGTTININVTSSYDNDQCVKREDVNFNANISCVTYTYTGVTAADDPYNPNPGGMPSVGSGNPCNDIIPYTKDGDYRNYKWVRNIVYKWPDELSSVSPRSVTLSISKDEYLFDILHATCNTESKTLTYNIGTKKSVTISDTADLGGRGLALLVKNGAGGGDRISSVHITSGDGPYKVGCINYTLVTDPVDW